MAVARRGVQRAHAVRPEACLDVRVRIDQPLRQRGISDEGRKMQRRAEIAGFVHVGAGGERRRDGVGILGENGVVKGAGLHGCLEEEKERHSRGTGAAISWRPPDRCPEPVPKLSTNRPSGQQPSGGH